MENMVFYLVGSNENPRGVLITKEGQNGCGEAITNLGNLG